MNFKNSRLCLNSEKLKTGSQKIMEIMTKNLIIFCVCMRICQQNWSRNDFCITFLCEMYILCPLLYIS